MRWVGEEKKKDKWPFPLFYFPFSPNFFFYQAVLL
jgi:hypothetical protein